MRNCTVLCPQKEYFWIQLPNNKILITDIEKTALLRGEYIFYKKKIYQVPLLEIECMMSVYKLPDHIKIKQKYRNCGMFPFLFVFVIVFVF